jgi:uncharacterized protein YcbX
MRVDELWRYPVKSMLGGTVAELEVTPHGAISDRAWALRDTETGRIVPEHFTLKSDTFLEIGALFVVCSGSIDHLRALQVGTALIDRRRFCPNVYVDTGGEPARFVEDEWLGRALAVGDEVVLDDLQPTLWCVTSTLAQEELPRDPSVLRTAAQNHKGCLGVYGSVRREGRLRVGDRVDVID